MKTKQHQTVYSAQKLANSSKKTTVQERKQLDKQYLQLREVVCNTEFYRTTSRHNRIRLNLWSSKLDQIVTNVSWKRNRNNYIKLMYLMTQSEVIVQPFTNLPPETELPFLRNYEMNVMVDMVENKVNQKIARFGYCRQCMADQKKINLPFHLSTPRQLMETDGQALAQGITHCNHSFFHPKQQNKKNYLMRDESQTTIEASQSSQANSNEVYSVYQSNQNISKNRYQTSIQIINNQIKISALKQIYQNNTSSNIIKYTQNTAYILDKSSSESQADLQQNVSIFRVKEFVHLNMRYKS